MQVKGAVNLSSVSEGSEMEITEPRDEWIYTSRRGSAVQMCETLYGIEKSTIRSTITSITIIPLLDLKGKSPNAVGSIINRGYI